MSIFIYKEYEYGETYIRNMNKVKARKCNIHYIRNMNKAPNQTDRTETANSKIRFADNNSYYEIQFRSPRGGDPRKPDAADDKCLRGCIANSQASCTTHGCATEPCAVGWKLLSRV